MAKRHYTWSHSRLNALEQCPKRAALQAAPSGPELRLGGAIHSLIHEWSNLFDADETDKIKKDDLIRDTATAFCLTQQQVDELQFMFHRWQKECDLQTICNAHHGFEVEMRLDEQGKRVETGAGYLGGIIDCVYDTPDNIWHIIDYKSDRGIPSESDERNIPQVEWYSGLFHQSCGQNQKAAGYQIVVWYLRSGIARELDVSITDAERYYQRCLERIKRAEHLGTAPSASNACSNCPIIKDCELFKQIKTPLNIQSVEDAAKATEIWQFAKGLTTQLDKALKAFVQEHGPVQYDGKILDYRQTERHVMPDAMTTYQRLHDLGMSDQAIWDHLNISAAVAEKIVKDGTEPRSAERKAALASIDEIKRLVPVSMFELRNKG